MTCADLVSLQTFGLTPSCATGQPLQNTPVQRQVESHYPELTSGLHLPKMARVVAPTEAVKSGNFSDPFRPRYAIYLQLLDADGNPDGSTPVYPAVSLPVPMAGNDSGMFQFPPEGTLVEVGFTAGRPDKPFVRQTMPDVKPGEQLQQQRAEVSQQVTQAGDWERKTDQAIRETSMSREVKADTETRGLVSRETTVKATDRTTVIGTASLMAGAIHHVTTGSYSVAAQQNQLITVGCNAESDITGNVAIKVGQALTEKIGQLRQSIAGTRQEIIAPVVWIGSEKINVAQLMLDTVALVQQLADQLASHTHPSTGQPTNSSAIAQSGQQAAASVRNIPPSWASKSTN